MSEKILEALAALASKLGTTAEYLWQVLIKQAAVSRAESIIVLTVTVTAILLFYHYIRKADWELDISTHQVLTIIFGFIGVVFTFLFVANVSTYLSAWLNPEGYALMKIMSKIGG